MCFLLEMARGKKMFLCLDVLVHGDLKRLPEGRSANRSCPG